MKILLSPAKRLNEKVQNEWPKSTTPQFLEKSEQLMEVLKNKSAKDLQKLMDINTDIAEMNVERNKNWKAKPTKSKSIQAGLMFDGEVYRGLMDMKLNEKSLKYLQENVMILSGLYGILRPMDRVMPYRLEMGTQLKIGKQKNLHEFWKNELTEFVNKKTKKGEILLDLASSEYIGTLDKKALKGKLIDVKFKDLKNGKLIQIMTYFKQARGQMANFCAENQVQTLEDLKKFDRMNYKFQANLSNEKTLVFTR